MGTSNFSDYFKRDGSLLRAEQANWAATTITMAVLLFV